MCGKSCRLSEIGRPEVILHIWISFSDDKESRFLVSSDVQDEFTKYIRLCDGVVTGARPVFGLWES